MNKIEFKKEVLEKARQSHQKVLEDIRYGIQEMQKSEMGLHEDQLDMDQRSLDESSNDTIARLSEQLDFAGAEMELLNRMIVQAPLHETIALGSIVETDALTFYISASIERFLANGKELFGISTHSPAFKAMKGLKKGDTFSVNNRHYQIHDVY